MQNVLFQKKINEDWWVNFCFNLQMLATNKQNDIFWTFLRDKKYQKELFQSLMLVSGQGGAEGRGVWSLNQFCSKMKNRIIISP